MTLKLILSETLELSQNGESVDLRNRKAQALLIYLALTGKPQSREHLASLLWGNRFDESARNSLRQALHALRKATSDDVVVGDDPLSLVENSFTLDDSDSNLLSGFRSGSEAFDSWLDSERERRRTDTAATLATRAEALKEAGDTAQALPLAEQALQLEPLAEPILRLVMTLLAAEGRRAEALALFHRFESRMKEELDAEPEALSQHIYNMLKQSETVDFRATPASEKQTNLVLVANFEDLGGGETATFIVRELPHQIVSGLNQLGYLGALQHVSIEYGDVGMSPDLIDRTRELGAMALITGSARQVGNRIRVSVRAHSSEHELLYNDSQVISEDESFDFIPDATDRLRNGLLVVWRQSLKVESRPMDVLAPLVGDAEKFRAIFGDQWMASFYSSHTRSRLAQMDEACDLALAEYPQDAFFLSAKSMVVFHRVQLSDRKDRVIGFREASDYVKRARSLEPGNFVAIHISMIPANWLGVFDEVREGYKTLSQPGTKAGSLDGLMALTHLFNGKYDAAIEGFQSTIRAETGYPVLIYRYAGLGLAYFQKGEPELALEAALSTLEISHEFWLAHLVAIAALEQLGRHDEALLAIERFGHNYRNPTVSEWDWLPFIESAPKQLFLETLRAAGLPD